MHTEATVSGIVSSWHSVPALVVKRSLVPQVGFEDEESGGRRPSRFSFRQPPARLSAMIWLNIAISAGALIVSPSRIATVRAVVF